jgi:hypothetical protein
MTEAFTYCLVKLVRFAAGRTSPATPGGLNLTDADRQEFRVKFEMSLGQ